MPIGVYERRPSIVIGQTKTCGTCGATIERRYGEGARNWADRKYCNRTCSINRPRPSLIDRVLSKCVEDESGCWVFTGALNLAGYGTVGDTRWRGSVARTHRVTYRFFIADIPIGLELDHLCRNRACCNPWHLDPVTTLVNAQRGSKAQQTHCVHGHEYTDENTRRARNGRRYCFTCSQIHDRARSAHDQAHADAAAKDRSTK